MSRVIWLTWKDHGHPQAGGAEVVAQQLTRRLAQNGHQVTILTCGYPGAAADEIIDGIRFIRVGRSRYLHPTQALVYYLRHLRGQYDVIIEEVQGCAPYLVSWFERQRSYLFYHQLARLNWLYEVPQPLGYVGYYGLAPLATRLVSLSQTPVITVSGSTRQVLADYGFAPERTHIISEGLVETPLTAASLKGIKKYPRPTLLSFGAMRAMKRSLDQVKAFELAKATIPELQLKIAGSTSGAYARKVLRHIARSPHAADIETLGHVSPTTRAELMQRSHVILQTPVEEGWGLTVSEANGQGTPAVAYNVSGLRDSIRHEQTGLITDPNPQALADAAVSLLQDPDRYQRLRQAAWQWSRQLTFDQAYQDFTNIIGVPA